jgi:hypothetical protein
LFGKLITILKFDIITNKIYLNMQIVYDLKEVFGKIESEFIADLNNIEEDIIYTPDYVIGKLKEIKSIINHHNDVIEGV